MKKVSALGYLIEKHLLIFIATYDIARISTTVI